MTAGGVNGPPVLNGDEFVQPAKTMGSLITDIIAGCGWIPQMSNVPTKTLGELRSYCMNTIGFPDPRVTAETRTLALVREDIIRRLGFYYSTTRAPGMDELILSFIAEAQATIFRRLELDTGDDAVPIRPSSTVDLTLDYVPVFNLALGLAKAHYGQQDAKAYFEITEQYLRDAAKVKPPHLYEMVRQALIDAQEEIHRRYESANLYWNLAAFYNETDSTTVDFRPVQAMATAILKAKMEQKDAQLYLNMVDRWFSDLDRRIPANAISTIRAHLKSAQEEYYFRYPVTRNERWFPVTLVAGESIYDVPKTSGLYADLRRVRSAWIKVGSTWTPLFYGIDPYNYSGTVTGPPTNYKMARYLEVWPTPAYADTVYLYGDLGLTDFDGDDDVATVDGSLLYIAGLAFTKASFGHKDAQLHLQRLDVHLKSLVSHSHGNTRYVPNPSEGCRPMIQPVGTWRA